MATEQEIQKLKNAIDRLCNILVPTRDGISDINEGVLELRPKQSYSRTKSLTGTLSALASEECISVTLRNNGNGLSFTVNGGVEWAFIDNEIETIFVTNASLIQVKGTDTLGYIVDKA